MVFLYGSTGLLNRKTSSSEPLSSASCAKWPGGFGFCRTGLWARPRTDALGSAFVIPRKIWPGPVFLPRNFRGWPRNPACCKNTGSRPRSRCTDLPICLLLRNRPGSARRALHCSPMSAVRGSSRWAPSSQLPPRSRSSSSSRNCGTPQGLQLLCWC
jgi:hypothetical protein